MSKFTVSFEGRELPGAHIRNMELPESIAMPDMSVQLSPAQFARLAASSDCWDWCPLVLSCEARGTRSECTARIASAVRTVNGCVEVTFNRRVKL